MIDVGAYRTGSNPLVDRAVQLNAPIKNFLRQQVNDEISFEDVVDSLDTLFNAPQIGGQSIG